MGLYSCSGNRLKKKTFHFVLGSSQLTNNVIVSGEQRKDLVICIYVSILPQTPLPSRLPHNTEQSAMCYTVGRSFLVIHVKYSREFGMDMYTLEIGLNRSEWRKQWGKIRELSRRWGTVHMDNLRRFQNMRHIFSLLSILGDTKDELCSRAPRCYFLPPYFFFYWFDHVSSPLSKRIDRSLLENSVYLVRGWRPWKGSDDLPDPVSSLSPVDVEERSRSCEAHLPGHAWKAYQCHRCQ